MVQLQAFTEIGWEENYFQKCGRPGEGGVSKSGHLRTRGEGGQKIGKICGRPIWMAPILLTRLAAPNISI